MVSPLPSHGSSFVQLASTPRHPAVPACQPAPNKASKAARVVLVMERKESPQWLGSAKSCFAVPTEFKEGRRSGPRCGRLQLARDDDDDAVSLCPAVFSFFSFLFPFLITIFFSFLFVLRSTPIWVGHQLHWTACAWKHVDTQSDRFELQLELQVSIPTILARIQHLG